VVNAPIVSVAERLQSPEALGGEAFSVVFFAGELSLVFFSVFFSAAESDSDFSSFVAFPE
jgi:hypothetical protein